MKYVESDEIISLVSAERTRPGNEARYKSRRPPSFIVEPSLASHTLSKAVQGVWLARLRIIHIVLPQLNALTSEEYHHGRHPDIHRRWCRDK